MLAAEWILDGQADKDHAELPRGLEVTPECLERWLEAAADVATAAARGRVA